jgi:hypothetical protein
MENEKLKASTIVVFLVASYALTCLIGIGIHEISWAMTLGVFLTFILLTGPVMGFCLGFVLNLAIIGMMSEDLTSGFIYGFVMLVQIVPLLILFLYYLFSGNLDPEEGFFNTLLTMGSIAWFTGLGFAVKTAKEA